MKVNPEERVEQRVSTEVFAARNHVKPQTVIKRLCLTQSYHGIKPVKLANGRWDWPDVVALKHRQMPMLLNDSTSESGRDTSGENKAKTRQLHGSTEE